jgi:hypothetical protein
MERTWAAGVNLPILPHGYLNGCAFFVKGDDRAGLYGEVLIAVFLAFAFAGFDNALALFLLHGIYITRVQGLV